MPLEHVLGQTAAVGTLERALATGKVHHAYRFEGPSGVGKEMTAFAFAQALVCTTPPPMGIVYQACGTCSACTRAVTLTAEAPRVPIHPDVVVLERGLYSAESLRRARAEVQDLSIDQVRRLVLERASFAPHEGRARVYRASGRRALDVSRQCTAQDTRRASRAHPFVLSPTAATSYSRPSDRARNWYGSLH